MSCCSLAALSSYMRVRVKGRVRVRVRVGVRRFLEEGKGLIPLSMRSLQFFSVAWGKGEGEGDPHSVRAAPRLGTAAHPFRVRVRVRPWEASFCNALSAFLSWAS